MSARTPGTLRLLLRPSMFLLHVPAALAVVAAVLLGNWQLGAWQEHREDRASELADAEPEPLGDVLGPDDPFPADGVGQPVRFTARWLPETTAYVAGRAHEGRDGYWMVTLAATGDAAVPVVLGWVPDPTQAPEPPTGTAELTGWLQPGERDGVLDPDPADDVYPALRIADLLSRSERDLYGGYVILRWRDPWPGLVPVTPASLPEAPAFTALRNLLYGVEWWLFAGFAVFLWWRWSRDEVAAARARLAAADAPAAGPSHDEPADRGPADARILSEP